MLKRIWNATASVHTTFWLLSLVTLFFVIGSVYFRIEKQFLPQLNFLLVPTWIQNIGWQHPGLSWWFFLLLFLLLLLGINTAACSVDRLLRLLPMRKKTSLLEFAVTLTPTLVHLVFILVLGGHLLSSFAGSVEKMSCVPGQTIELSGQRELRVLSVRSETRSRPASLAGKLARMSADLHFRAPGFDGSFTVAILAPAQRAGFSFHLDSVDKYARSRELMLIIRRDPGMRLIIPGLLVIIALMLWYFPALWILKNKSKSKEK